MSLEFLAFQNYVCLWIQNVTCLNEEMDREKCMKITGALPMNFYNGSIGVRSIPIGTLPHI